VHRLLLAFTLLLTHCAQPQHTLTGATMGTTYSVVLRAKDLSPGHADTLRETLQAELDWLESIFSTYRADSEISRLNNRYQPNRPYPVSNDMAEVLRIAVSVKAVTGGAFSPLVGAIVDYWGFGPGKAADQGVKQPAPAALGCESRAAFSLVTAKGSQNGASLVITKDATPACARHKPKLDLSAIAKGYAVDRLVLLLAKRGFSNYLVEIGGEVCVVSTQGKPWRIGIEDPLQGGAFAQVVMLENGCVATSGNGRQGRFANGRLITHIVDPRTGLPLTGPRSSVSVIAATGADADAWATGLYVLGSKEAIALADAKGLGVLYLEEASGRLERSASVAWPR